MYKNARQLGIAVSTLLDLVHLTPPAHALLPRIAQCDWLTDSWAVYQYGHLTDHRVSISIDVYRIRRTTSTAIPKYV